VFLLWVDFGLWLGGGAPGGGRAPRSGGEAPRQPLRGRTLRGYFRHQRVFDPYVRIGRQDLTADVDFSALDLHGRQVGFETVLFTSVAALLCADGGEDRLRRLHTTAGGTSSRALTADREATVLEALLDDEGIGGTFKVMLQVKE
jgi:SAM-dependent MidA family methyltransferase